MSIKVSSHVWENSKQKGNNLIVLLKIADNAHDNGHAWPGIKYLAEKARITRRAAGQRVEALAKSGELIVIPNAGYVNDYIIPMTSDQVKSAYQAIAERRDTTTTALIQARRIFAGRSCILSSRGMRRNIPGDAKPDSHEPLRTNNKQQKKNSDSLQAQKQPAPKPQPAPPSATPKLTTIQAGPTPELVKIWGTMRGTCGAILKKHDLFMGTALTGIDDGVATLEYINDRPAIPGRDVEAFLLSAIKRKRADVQSVTLKARGDATA